VSRAWIHREMIEPPALDPRLDTGPVERRRALLINPFYPEDPHERWGDDASQPEPRARSARNAARRRRRSSGISPRPALRTVPMVRRYVAR